MKRCPKCNTDKSCESFYKSKRTKDGLFCWCKICQTTATKLHAKSAKGKAQARERWAQLPIEERRKRQKMYSKGYFSTPNGRATRKRYRSKPEVKARENARRIFKLFGISMEEYNRLFEGQAGCCAICKVHQSGLQKSLAVDHNHKTGAVRGLLCIPCNVALGNFKDNCDTLASAIAYLRSV